MSKSISVFDRIEWRGNFGTHPVFEGDPNNPSTPRPWLGSGNPFKFTVRIPKGSSGVVVSVDRTMYDGKTLIVRVDGEFSQYDKYPCVSSPVINPIVVLYGGDFRQIKRVSP